jgi:hypothetical protein
MEIAERAESNGVWETELVLNDPLIVFKRPRDPGETGLHLD